MKYAPKLVLAAFASGMVILSASAAFADEKVKSRAGVGRSTSTVATEETKRLENREAAECEAMWDAGTHMTKQQWSATCRRVQNRLQQFDIR
jgi:hypothetical protein